jgi:high-affinity iron transporter
MGETVWDTSWLLSEKSLFGQLMHTLIGYVSQPTALQIVAYIGTLAAMYVLMRIARYRPEARPVRV